MASETPRVFKLDSVHDALPEKNPAGASSLLVAELLQAEHLYHTVARAFALKRAYGDVRLLLVPGFVSDPRDRMTAVACDQHSTMAAT